MRRGRGGKEKEWTDCVQSDIGAFGIKGDWEEMASKAEVSVEAVTEGGGGFWPRGENKRKTRPDVARRRERQRDFFVFLPIHSGHQWTYQPGSHRRKVTQDFSFTFLLRCVPLFFSREGFSLSFPSSTVKSNFVVFQ